MTRTNENLVLRAQILLGFHNGLSFSKNVQLLQYIGNLFNNQYFGSDDFAHFWTKIVHYLFPRSLERDPILSQRLDRLKHWRPPLCFTYLRPRWHIEATATSLSGICWNLGWRSMLFSLAVLFTGSRFFAIIAEYQNEFYQIK